MAISIRRQLLRTRTSAAHEALDAAVGNLDSLPLYRRYLRGLQAFRVAAEALLPEALGDWRPGRISALMREDMADLGVEPAPPARIEGIDGASERLGLLYVLEGSALGARLLRRQAAALGLGASNGARHLEAQAGSLDGWHRFLQILDETPDFDAATAIAGAEAAFAAALSCFAESDGSMVAGSRA